MLWHWVNTCLFRILICINNYLPAASHIWDTARFTGDSSPQSHRDGVKEHNWRDSCLRYKCICYLSIKRVLWHANWLLFPNFIVNLITDDKRLIEEARSRARKVCFPLKHLRSTDSVVTEPQDKNDSPMETDGFTPQDVSGPKEVTEVEKTNLKKEGEGGPPSVVTDTKESSQPSTSGRTENISKLICIGALLLKISTLGWWPFYLTC